MKFAGFYHSASPAKTKRLPPQLLLIFSPNESSCPFECVQIDLIGRCLTPDTGYTWILHAKDHFSKVTTPYPLIDYEAMTVAVAFQNWIMAYGPPKVVQCDNGTELQG